jgi:hypothetical protein
MLGIIIKLGPTCYPTQASRQFKMILFQVIFLIKLKQYFFDLFFEIKPDFIQILTKSIMLVSQPNLT